MRFSIPDLTIIEETLVPADAAQTALDAFAEFGIDGWLFTRDIWFVKHENGIYVPKERRTIQHEPVVVDSFEPYLDQGRQTRWLVGRISIASLPARPRWPTGSAPRATAKRSQKYYLDVTPFGFDKGEAARRIARVLNVPISELAVIGDMANDLPMFDVATYKIAMGNGIDELKQMADFVTDDNEHDGFAAAVDRFILPRAALASSRMTRDAAKISLLLADVDGTLVTHEKILTERAIKAVADLKAAGIRFAITSGRPPKGMEMVIKPLAIETPIAGFNGGLFTNAESIGDRGAQAARRCRAGGHRDDRRRGARRLALFRQRLADSQRRRPACRAGAEDGAIRPEGRRRF